MSEVLRIFDIKHKNEGSRARTGTLHLPHGDVRTPVFMPVGTNATVKAMPKDFLEEIDFDIILANTYHLFLRPGPDLIKEAGGLHGFSQWKKNFLTDSGGFQVFSLSKLRKITDEGVRFQSHIDGSYHMFTPENVVQTQTKFNSDIQMQLDVCSGWGVERKEAEKALRITSDWLVRAKGEWEKQRADGYQGILFPIVQGNFFEGSQWLMAWADTIEEVKTICWCGKKAICNARIFDGKVVKEGDQILLGGNSQYISLCRKHWAIGDPGTFRDLHLSD